MQIQLKWGNRPPLPLFVFNIHVSCKQFSACLISDKKKKKKVTLVTFKIPDLPVYSISLLHTKGIRLSQTQNWLFWDYGHWISPYPSPHTCLVQSFFLVFPMTDTTCSRVWLPSRLCSPVYHSHCLRWFYIHQHGLSNWTFCSCVSPFMLTLSFRDDKKKKIHGQPYTS